MKGTSAWGKSSSRLMRGAAPSRIDEEAASERATTTRLQLEDANRPSDKALYRIGVTP